MMFTNGFRRMDMLSSCAEPSNSGRRIHVLLACWSNGGSLQRARETLIFTWSSFGERN
jgi:hypothetical protein